ncbi:MAG: ABC transporter ATP-binding protein [Comamonadaceae bacterium CG1_02_60_18]|nr:MAG: ABC transporter ATP-binding protein [Comamonadaceae bacterium CG1_02_60_18]PIQ52117.1 MAG: ABC transporter ATP-binding protein [Comamonadaceae bacterium CG12_big_fil_rev_8_21_14_0_65_59_15]
MKPRPIELELKAVTQSYADKRVIDGLSLALHQGEIGCLLGASGCGKTTALRCIAGFEAIDGGEICIAGQSVSATGRFVPAQERQVGMVFQDYALFTHLSVADNVAFGLRHLSREARRARVRQLLELVGLADEADRQVHQISGGQQQRVALARALAPKPKLLLMDEPFSNLDVALRERLSGEVRDILKLEGSTALIVTHDQHEAFALADRVGVLHAGRIMQWDTPYNLYHQPVNRFVADFIGQGAFLPAEVLSGHQLRTELGELEGEVPSSCNQGGCQQCQRGCRVEVLLRPDDIVHDDASPLLAEVQSKAFRGAEFLYTLGLPSGQRALSLVPSHHDHAIGEKIGIRLAADHVVAFRREDARPGGFTIR